MRDEDARGLGSDDYIDVDSPYNLVGYPDKQKKDELVSVHKYFAPKRAVDVEYEEPEYRGSDLDLLLDQLRESDVEALG